jgi:hypothetical protein
MSAFWMFEAVLGVVFLAAAGMGVKTTFFGSEGEMNAYLDRWAD